MTAQMGDILYYEGKKHYMASEPPIHSTAAGKYDIRFLGLLTACWRGYQAVWEVKDKQLFIKSVKGTAKVTDKEKFRQKKLELRKLLREGVITPAENGHLLKKIYNDLTKVKKVGFSFLYGSREPVFASWFSGTIRLPLGKMLEYVHMDYFSVYEEDLLLTFENGILKHTIVMVNDIDPSNRPEAPSKSFFTDSDDDIEITPL